MGERRLAPLEGDPMKCWLCDQPATIHVTELVDGRAIEVDLCETHGATLLEDTPLLFAKFTERARRVVGFASAEAERLGHAAADTVDLLLGMIREGMGIAGVALAQHGIGADTVIRLYDSVSAQPDVTFDELTARSHREAKWFGHPYMGTEHLLLAVCCMTDSRAARLLRRVGKHPVELCRFVVEILGHHHEWDRWLAEHRDVARGG